MKPIMLAAASALMLGAGAMTGCATTQDETRLAEAGADNSERVICRRIHEVGSRLSSRVCRTQAQWDDEAAGAQQRLDEYDHTRSSYEPLPPTSG